MEVIDGNAVASDLLEELASKVQAFEGPKTLRSLYSCGRRPGFRFLCKEKRKNGCQDWN